MFIKGSVLKSKLQKDQSQDFKWHMVVFQHPKH